MFFGYSTIGVAFGVSEYARGALDSTLLGGMIGEGGALKGACVKFENKSPEIHA